MITLWFYAFSQAISSARDVFARALFVHVASHAGVRSSDSCPRTVTALVYRSACQCNFDAVLSSKLHTSSVVKRIWPSKHHYWCSIDNVRQLSAVAARQSIHRVRNYGARYRLESSRKFY